MSRWKLSWQWWWYSILMTAKNPHGRFYLHEFKALKWNRDSIKLSSENCWVTLSLSLILIYRFWSYRGQVVCGNGPNLEQRETISEPTVGNRSCINSAKMLSLKLPHDSSWYLFFLFAASKIPRFMLNVEFEGQCLWGCWDKSWKLWRRKYKFEVSKWPAFG